MILIVLLIVLLSFPAFAGGYFKPNATTEEFERTKAECLARAETAAAASTDPSPMSRSSTRLTVFGYCMRSHGWTYRQ